MLPLRVMPEPDGSRDLPSLLEDARQGDERAFGRLVSRIEGTIRRWARRITADDDDADDVTQDVLVLVQRRLPQFEARSRFSTWLYRITRNVALEKRRRDARRARMLEAYPPESSTLIPVDRFDEDTLAALILGYFAEL
ncbi:MAG TPA: sigma-70 family RNA polymerase sigma factor, partial [Gemmatimonadaceae bacterium]